MGNCLPWLYVSMVVIPVSGLMIGRCTFRRCLRLRALLYCAPIFAVVWGVAWPLLMQCSVIWEVRIFKMFCTASITWLSAGWSMVSAWVLLVGAMVVL